MRDLLLVTDMQNVYTKNQKWACLDTEGAAKRILKIIDFAEKNGKIVNTEQKINNSLKKTQKDGQNTLSEYNHLDVIFTRFLPDENPTGVWKNYNEKYADVNSDSFANEMLPEFEQTLKKYPLYTKHVYSSLAIPQVVEAAQKADRVIITGVVAECCVLSTVFALMDAGIYTIYLTDAVSGLTREKELATELTLEGLSPLHVSMMTVDEYLEQM